MGVIGEELQGLHYYIVDNTNTENVLDFFKALFEGGSVPLANLSKTAIVMDNHSAHTTPPVTNYLRGLGITPLFIPPVSSPLNPIEEVWALFKRRWRRRLVERPPAPGKQAIFWAMGQELNAIPKPAIKSLSRGSLREMQNVLNGMPV